MFNLVELIAGDHEPAPCKWGNIVKDHACYCHNDDCPFRKCPHWRYNNYVECEFFAPHEKGRPNDVS